MRDTSQTGKKHVILWTIVFVICCLVVTACAAVFGYHFVLRRQMATIYDKARVEIPDRRPGREETGTDSSDAADPSVLPTVRIDFEYLQSVAPDAYAWIEIPGTEISYPIVQHPKNDAYYIRRAETGSYDVTGCIFTESLNARDFSDPLTVVYGHYMYDGTKFGPLLNYSDATYFEEHRTVLVYTETELLTYEVFAAVPYGVRHLLKTFPYPSDFLTSVRAIWDARAMFAEGAREEHFLQEDDRVLVLSTCMKNNARRFLVLAVLVDSQPYT